MEERPSRREKIIAWTLTAATVTVWVIAHAPALHPTFGQLLKWPRYVLVAISLWFLAGVFLPDAWHYRKSDLGGLFFVLCMIGIGVFAMWALLTGWGG